MDRVLTKYAVPPQSSPVTTRTTRHRHGRRTPRYEESARLDSLDSTQGFGLEIRILQMRGFGPARLGYYRAICNGDRYQATAGGGY